MRGYLPEALVNYLALIGWSPGASSDEPGTNDELLPVAELARRFAIEDVGHSAGIFDVEKLSWMNRHYMKVAAPGRIAAEAIRYFLGRGYVRKRTDAALEYITSLLPMAVGSVDRLEEIPERVQFIFEFDAVAALHQPDVAQVLSEPGAREVIAALPEAVDGPLVDKEAFRAAATRVRERTGMKGKALFHPIRVALTGSDGGPELDLAVPAIERGAALPASASVARIASCKERAVAFAKAIG
jgi:glutamyl-tRNA synthetase/nondiscriminating glutamyl-tRNA synthetase